MFFLLYLSEMPLNSPSLFPISSSPSLLSFLYSFSPFLIPTFHFPLFLFLSPSCFPHRFKWRGKEKRRRWEGRESWWEGKNTIIFLTALRLSSCSFVFCLMWRFTFLFLILEQADTGAPRPVYTQTDWQCLSVCLSLAVSLFYLKRKSSN